jgi:hypothetical protein
VNNSYNKIENVARLLFEVSEEMRAIDIDISTDYLLQARDFISLIPIDAPLYSKEEKNEFKDLILGEEYGRRLYPCKKVFYF